MEEKLNNFELLSKINYLVHFITRAFLIAILGFMLLFVLIIAVYFGDLLLNINSSNHKNPLFGAYVIVSPSMVPTIMINDAIVIKRVDNDKYKIGDIITFVSSDSNYKGLTITHRVVDKLGVSDKNSIYTTKGDNNQVIDPATVSTRDIYGKVLFKIPKIGYIQDFFAKPINYFICLVIPAIIFVLYDSCRIIYVVLKRKKMS